MSLLAVEDLRVRFGDVVVVDGVDLALDRGEALAIVGESGSGKSMTALALLGLVPPPGRVEARRLALDGEELLALAPDARRRLGGRAIAMVFQDPMTALNPVRRVGALLVEAIRRHQPLDAAAARRRAVECLAEVGVPEPELRLRAYAHELSGGLRQRVTIAMALANRPRLILADEPTTALDATIQAQILELLRERVRDAALILITHDLGVAAALCRRVAVMYCGGFVETGPAEALLARPGHPYTRGLVAAVPRFDARRPPLAPIPGVPLAAKDRPAGCAFAARCPRADGRCRADVPALRTLAPDRRVACHHPDSVA